MPTQSQNVSIIQSFSLTQLITYLHSSQQFHQDALSSIFYETALPGEETCNALRIVQFHQLSICLHKGYAPLA